MATNNQSHRAISKKCPIYTSPFPPLAIILHRKINETEMKTKLRKSLAMGIAVMGLVHIVATFTPVIAGQLAPLTTAHHRWSTSVHLYELDVWSVTHIGRPTHFYVVRQTTGSPILAQAPTADRSGVSDRWHPRRLPHAHQSLRLDNPMPDPPPSLHQQSTMTAPIQDKSRQQVTRQHFREHLPDHARP